MGVPTGSNLGAAQGSITISTSQLAAARAAVNAFATGVNTTLTGMNPTINKAQSGINGLAGSFRELAGAFGFSLGVAGVVQLAKMTIALSNNAAQAERTKDQYEVLASGVGQSADSMLDSMRRASKGMIADNELILSANRAMLLGVAKNSKEMEDLLNASRVLGQAMGQDVGKSFNDLVIGLGRLSPLILDNLGIANEGEQMFENYAQSVGRTADSLSKAEKRQILLNQVMKAAQPLLDAEAGKAENQADKTERLGAAWDNYTDSLGRFINTYGGVPVLTDGVSSALETQTGILGVLVGWWNKYRDAVGGAGAATEAWLGAQGIPTGAPTPKAPGVPKWMTGVSPSASGPLASVRTGEINDAKLNWSKGITELDERTNAEILEQGKDYNRQRAASETDYQKAVSREARNFYTSRQREEEDYLDSIADIHQSAARRETRMAQDLARSIADAQSDTADSIAKAREDTNERLVELEEDYAKDRERAATDHRDKMLSLAGRLDAIGLLEERKRWSRENKDAKEAHDEQRDDLKEQLAERIDEENKALAKSIAQAKDAHQRQLDDARENDRLRLEDMDNDFRLRKEREDADRTTRLNDMAADHKAQLDEMDATHGLRLAQIHNHAQAERNKLDEEHKEEMLALGVRNDAWLGELRRAEAARRKIYDEEWGNTGRGHPSTADPYIDRLPPSGSSVPPAATSGMGSGAGGRSFSVGTISVSVMGTTNMGESQLYDVARRAVVDALEEVAGG